MSRQLVLKEQHLPQLFEDDADIVPCAAEQGIYFVAQLAHQVVPPQLAIRLHVTNHRFDGASSFQFLFHLRSHAPFSTGN